MWFFLAALTMLFGSSMLGYFVIRLTGASAPSGRVLHLPPLLWLSTAVIVASSISISRALGAIRQENQKAFRQALVMTLALAITFVAIQAPALVELLRTHEQMMQTGLRLYGMLFFLVLLHALHVVGGIIMLVVVAHNAFQRRYDHEHYTPVYNATLYWHFLDLVWLLMFLSMWSVG
jgi:cytochrome c oxidase subunit 3